jgi:hypothetical protein
VDSTLDCAVGRQRLRQKAVQPRGGESSPRVLLPTFLPRNCNRDGSRAVCASLYHDELGSHFAAMRDLVGEFCCQCNLVLRSKISPQQRPISPHFPSPLPVAMNCDDAAVSSAASEMLQGCLLAHQLISSGLFVHLLSVLAAGGTGRGAATATGRLDHGGGGGGAVE